MRRARTSGHTTERTTEATTEITHIVITTTTSPMRKFLHLKVLLLPLLMNVPYAIGIGFLRVRLVRKNGAFRASNGFKLQTKEQLMLVTFASIPIKQKATEVPLGMAR